MSYSSVLNTDVLEGLLSVDEKTKDFVVVWFCKYGLAFCKKGDDHYSEILAYGNFYRLLQSVDHAVLRGYLLYIVTANGLIIRLLDFSSRNQRGYADIDWNMPTNYFLDYRNRIVVRTSREILFIENNLKKAWFIGEKSFRLYNISSLDEVNSLDDEALFLDLGITVPVNDMSGIEPNSIYFTFQNPMSLNLNICVYDIATKTIKRFSDLSNMNLNDARWFLPEI